MEILPLKQKLSEMDEKYNSLKSTINKQFDGSVLTEEQNQILEGLFIVIGEIRKDIEVLNSLI